jgi:hypothetical protein
MKRLYLTTIAAAVALAFAAGARAAPAHLASELERAAR